MEKKYVHFFNIQQTLLDKVGNLQNNPDAKVSLNNLDLLFKGNIFIKESSDGYKVIADPTNWRGLSTYQKSAVLLMKGKIDTMLADLNCQLNGSAQCIQSARNEVIELRLSCRFRP